MVEHQLLTDAPYFDAVERGEKTFDVRRDDRGFQKGDVVELIRVTKGVVMSHPDPDRRLRRVIAYILTGGQLGIEPGYVVLGLTPEVDIMVNRGGAYVPRDVSPPDEITVIVER